MMVTSFEQALAIQKSRVENGQYGFAKAVRRFFKREVLKNCGKFDWYAMNKLKQEVPYLDPACKGISF